MNDLKKRRGKIIISRELLIEEPNEDVLRAIFSNFFPIHTEINNGHSFHSGVTYLGYSSYFREIEEIDEIPEYMITINTDQNGCISFEGVVENNTIGK